MTLLAGGWDRYPATSLSIFTITGIKRLILSSIEENIAGPMIIETVANLIWLCDFSLVKGQNQSDQSVQGVYLIGPMLGGRDSHLVLRKKMDEQGLSVKQKNHVQRVFDEIPAVATHTMEQYLQMMHWILTRERLALTSIRHISPSDPDSLASNLDKNTPPHSTNPHIGIWENEEKFCRLIAAGDPRYRDYLLRSSQLSTGIKANNSDSMRNNKNNLHVLLTLVSRACIRGGLSPAISYDMHDNYAGRIEACRTLREIRQLSVHIMDDYFQRMRSINTHPEISPAIRKACDYIRLHPSEDLSIRFLAGKAGYSHYYFSQKFKKETGMTVSDFIMREKLEQAKELLADPVCRVQDISEQLRFHSRSYFYKCFLKYTGMSPSQYRKDRITSGLSGVHD